MGLLHLRSHAMLLLVVPVCLFSFSLPYVVAQSDTKTSARALDALLQDYAYTAFVRPRTRTGIVYNGYVPSNMTGMKIAAMRLRSGSLRKRGVKIYKEFGIPIGVTESPYVERLVLVYQNLGNWSKTYYPLPGYTYLSPVLGLLAYDASNLTATNLPELEIRASGDPLSITFQDMMSAPAGSVAKCVWFDLHGLTNFSNATSGNTCTTTEQGHFSIVVESVAPSLSPSPRREKKKSNSKVWIIVVPVLVGLALLVLWLHKHKHKKKMEQMQKAAADVGEA
ncbi:hypothetical protein LWI29_029122 [Acer saccharum]|uniref:Uncharacterized protein n=1 Tax=Acer saccharum TaxID=4024 RepID=A0AA39T6Z3_ACESA|nr:hypothetical protein LWI29_029122 [Acer saccharum]